MIHAIKLKAYKNLYVFPARAVCCPTQSFIPLIKSEQYGTRVVHNGNAYTTEGNTGY